jgi:hypothetical protein
MFIKTRSMFFKNIFCAKQKHISKVVKKNLFFLRLTPTIPGQTPKSESEIFKKKKKEKIGKSFSLIMLSSKKRFCLFVTVYFLFFLHCFFFAVKFCESPTAIYTHCYSPDNSKIFMAGGPTQVNYFFLFIFIFFMLPRVNNSFIPGSYSIPSPPGNAFFRALKNPDTCPN